MVTPRCRSRSITRNSRATSASVRALVGSSMIRMSVSSDSALAISTSCWSPTRSSRTGRRGGTPHSSCTSKSAAARSMARSSSRPSRVRFSRPRKMLAAADRFSTRFSSWWMMATPAASAARVSAKRTGCPRRRSCPS
jgi:hypothetical protein